MSEYKVKFLPQDIEVMVPEGMNLLEAQIKAGIHPDAPCGGKGTCGKCLVNVKEGTPLGVVKACTTKVTGDMVVNVQTDGGHSILLKGVHRNIAIKPAIRSVNVTVRQCELGENLSDWKRLKEAVAEAAGIKEEDIPVNRKIVSHLYEDLQK